MSLLEYNIQKPPEGFWKIRYFNWALLALVCAIASFGFVMLYSVAGGSMEPWASAQLWRFGFGAPLMVAMAFVPIWIWRSVSVPAYLLGLALLVFVEFFGHTGMGAQRWIDLGFMRLQPSELMKVCLVMTLAAYYDWLDISRVSRPVWVAPPLALTAVPVLLILRQPDLGTALLLLLGGGILMFLAGVSWLYFLAVAAAAAAVVILVFFSRGTEWQLLADYQYRRIDAFLDPSSDPLGAGYHITQAQIALGSGGWQGRGFMQGTQSNLNFLPEKHTDFIFTTLAEEFGFIGTISLLGLYGMVILFCAVSGASARDRYSSLLILGLTGTFFLYFSVNISMAVGLAPVVGVPLPLVSYGGSAMIVLMIAFGLIQSAHIHRIR